MTFYVLQSLMQKGKGGYSARIGELFAEDALQLSIGGVGTDPHATRTLSKRMMNSSEQPGPADENLSQSFQLQPFGWYFLSPGGVSALLQRSYCIKYTVYTSVGDTSHHKAPAWVLQIGHLASLPQSL